MRQLASALSAAGSKLQQLAEHKGCAFAAKIVTNGVTLSEKIAIELVHQHKVEEIEITLDGLANFHDARRVAKNGKPTFERTFKNLLAIASRDDLKVGLSVRCNVDVSNADGVDALIDKLAEAGLQRRISFYTAPIHSWGNDAHLSSLSAEEYGAREIEWLSKMVSLGFNVRLIPARRPIVCMAARTEAELVDANGELFNCTEVSYVPAYGTPNSYRIGHVTTGERPGARDLLGQFNKEVGLGTYECSRCPMLPVCGGGCPKNWREGLVACPPAKFNIADRLLLLYATDRCREIAEQHTHMMT